jgi:hypothetical protein
MDWLMHNRIQPLIAPLCKECSILKKGKAIASVKAKPRME